jgi:hypothetical protein
MRLRIFGFLKLSSLLIFPCMYLYLIATYFPDLLSEKNAGTGTLSAATAHTAQLPSSSHKLPPQDWKAQHRAAWKEFDAQVRRLTPTNAQDCGTALLETSEKKRIPVDSCAVAALRVHQPFHARYYVGMPQKIATKMALIGTPQGYVHFRWIIGGVGSVLPSVGEHLCKSPEIVAAHGQPRIECPDWRKQ